MMKLYFGYKDKYIVSVDSFFDNIYDEEWFEDETVKQIVKDIDNSTVLSKNCIESEVLGQIPPQWISGGAKGLILLLKYKKEDDYDEDFYPNLIIFGDNCMEWLGKISKIRDFEACISTYDLSFKGGNIYSLSTNKIINNSNDWFENLMLIRKNLR